MHARAKRTAVYLTGDAVRGSALVCDKRLLTTNELGCRFSIVWLRSGLSDGCVHNHYTDRFQHEIKENQNKQNNTPRNWRWRVMERSREVRGTMKICARYTLHIHDTQYSFAPHTHFISLSHTHTREFCCCFFITNTHIYRAITWTPNLCLYSSPFVNKPHT